VAPKDTLLLDDGRIVLTVTQVEGPRVICQVKVGGELSNNKGINRLAVVYQPRRSRKKISQIY